MGLDMADSLSELRINEDGFVTAIVYRAHAKTRPPFSMFATIMVSSWQIW